jgi:indole-3-glycerol phosphate synthase
VILDAILANKRREIAERQTRRPLRSIEADIARAAPTARPFDLALRVHPGVSIIAEIKRKSPSGGELRPGASAANLAALYAAHGAAAVSVLTDQRYFGGEDADLVEARQASGLAVLRKDFVVDPYQVYEARALGADAILLIARTLAPVTLVDLLRCTHRLGMQALVETHSADEVRAALDAGARVVGVNNRDLDTLATDTTLALRLRSLVPAECVFVAESGVSRPEHIAALAAVGADAVLIGEALVRAADPGAQLRDLVSQGAGPRVVSGDPRRTPPVDPALAHGALHRGSVPLEAA